MGDSISAGYGIEANQGWVSLLSKRLETLNYPYQVINASISGDTTSNGLTRLPQALAAHHPAITILELGGNDGLRGIPIQVIKKNLQRMITLIIAANSKLILLGFRLPPNYGPDYTQQFQTIYLDLGKENNVPVIANFLKQVDDNPALMQDDGIHPKTAAQTQLLENIWPTLKPLLQR